MKKLLTILLSATVLVVNADDTTDLLEVLETNNAINEQKEVVDYYISQRIYQLETQPKFMASKLSYCNTFMWYIWNDYEEAKGFNKIELGEQIYKLTK